MARGLLNVNMNTDDFNNIQNREYVTRAITLTIKAVAGLALIMFAVGCSEFNAPTASQPSQESSGISQYPPIENTLAAIEAAGYRAIDLAPRTALDDQDCDTVTASRFCRQTNQSNLNLAGIVLLTVPGAVLPQDMTITVVAPSSCFGVADFYPHPTQFNGNVSIRWDTQSMGLPPDVELEDIVPLYIHDDGTPEEVSFTLSENRFITVHTNHFSRYIITQRVIG